MDVQPLTLARCPCMWLSTADTTKQGYLSSRLAFSHPLMPDIVYDMQAPAGQQPSLDSGETLGSHVLSLCTAPPSPTCSIPGQECTLGAIWHHHGKVWQVPSGTIRSWTPCRSSRTVRHLLRQITSICGSRPAPRLLGTHGFHRTRLCAQLEADTRDI